MGEVEEDVASDEGESEQANAGSDVTRDAPDGEACILFRKSASMINWLVLCIVLEDSM